MVRIGVVARRVLLGLAVTQYKVNPTAENRRRIINALVSDTGKPEEEWGEEERRMVQTLLDNPRQ